MWFPEKNDPELERLAGLVFDLRRKQFRREVYTHAHEREWEDDDHERERERHNEEKRLKWDNETLRLILGHTSPSEPLRDRRTEGD